MINLTSIEDLVISLISKYLGNDEITFIVYPKDDVVEFSSKNYKLVITKYSDYLRVYDNGNVYLIPNILPENYCDVFHNIFNQQAEKLSDYYKLIGWNENVSDKDTRMRLYTFKRLNTN
jgi:hypothetical protein